jgi:hypothetical protein
LQIIYYDHFRFDLAVPVRKLFDRSQNDRVSHQVAQQQSTRFDRKKVMPARAGGNPKRRPEPDDVARDSSIVLAMKGGRL